MSYFKNPRQVVRIAKRNTYSYRPYYVVGVGLPVGHGLWLKREEIRPLSPLELLAMQLDANLGKVVETLNELGSSDAANRDLVADQAQGVVKRVEDAIAIASGDIVNAVENPQ